VEALAALDRMVRDGVRAFPRRGLEIGGLLTGFPGTGGEDEIRLDAICPLPMEYRSGPAFQPSPSDLLFIKQSVVRSPASETSIIGHFRSQTSGEPHPSDVDRNIASLLNLREALLVLVPASVAGVEPARLYRAVNGEWNFLLSFPLIDQPLNEEPLTEQPLVELPRELGMAQGLELQRDKLAAVQGRASARARRDRLAWGGLAVGLACGIFFGHSIWQSRPAAVLPPRPNVTESSSGIHLELHPTGSALKVQWNPASSPIAQGFSGILTVRDGARQLQIPLDRHQLETGSTVYYPESEWVEVRLEVYRDGTHFTGETVAMATGLSKRPLPETAEEPAAAAPAEASRNPKRKPERSPAKKTRSTRQTPAKSLRRYQGPAAQRTAPAQVALPLAPEISLARPLPAPLTPPVAPSGPPAGSSAASSAGTGSADLTIRYEAAVPLRKVRPAVPDELHSILPESTSITVRIEIDAAGRVIGATPEGNLTATQKLLARQAVQAARLWRFQPARKNGEAVESESLLRFDFERDQ
jgi:periplasmic protein TonB